MRNLPLSSTRAVDDSASLLDPGVHPEYFGGVIGRRSIAFIIDAAIILTLSIFMYPVLAIAGLFTFGLAWLLFGLVFPLVALGYNAFTVSQPHSATIGMRMVELEMRTWDGDRMNALLGAFHALLFYFTITMLTPFVLLLPFFNARRRCLHDFFSGVVVVNAQSRAQSR